MYYWEKVQSALYILYRVSTQHLFTAHDMCILYYTVGERGGGSWMATLASQCTHSREEELAIEGEGETWSRGMRGIWTRVPESTTHILVEAPPTPRPGSIPLLLVSFHFVSKVRRKRETRTILRAHSSNSLTGGMIIGFEWMMHLLLKIARFHAIALSNTSC